MSRCISDNRSPRELMRRTVQWVTLWWADAKCAHADAEAAEFFAAFVELIAIERTLPWNPKVPAEVPYRGRNLGRGVKSPEAPPKAPESWKQKYDL